ncbi:FAD-dependent monooxygenase [Wohlfahrtiimonas larvae]|uniref:2-octaprenyl-6-methoxyphenyl hydroxylase n=1 Tax=Wohlfahrtiimonas larvae TaxID=1157986 RepID=A0ABP9MX84_9GAMM|nr:FAD-dependent monooxygenase [Wohlfahrtiimonas larvae]
MNDHRLSFCISGAGPIGLALALGLGQSGYHVKLLDQKPQIDKDILVDDRRMLALSHRTVEFFKRLGVWDPMLNYATAINAVHVSQKKCKVEVLMKASQHNLDHFGYLVPQGRVILALYEQVFAHADIELCLGSKITPNADLSDGTVVIQQNNKKNTETFDWLIAAEGVNSVLRNNFGIETFSRDYDQIAVIARVTFEKPHQNIAYERFTDEGPLALLPVNDNEMAVVLVTDSRESDKWKKASDLTYAAEILARIGARLGDITEVTERQVWPLTLMIPKKVVDGKLLLAGNSAHGLHPIAGQGLNLGIRDCEAIIDLFAVNQYPTDNDLIAFNNARHKDIVKTVGATDFLVNAFGVKGTLAQTARSLGLLGVKTLPFVKKKIAKVGMGY